MITSILLAATVASASPTMAECDQVERLAHTIMKARQNGIAASTMVKAVADNKAIIGVIQDAYKRPQFSSDEYKQNAVVKFGNDYYMACLEQVK